MIDFLTCKPFSVAALFVSFPFLSFAENMIISDPNFCNASEDSVMDSGGYIMSDRSIEAIEFICEFDPLPKLDLGNYHTFTSKGYCAGPMFFIPQVLAFNFGRDVGDIEVIGQFAQYEPSGRIVFHVCEK